MSYMTLEDSDLDLSEQQLRYIGWHFALHSEQSNKRGLSHINLHEQKH